MKPPAFAYHAPTTVKEAVALLSQNENARVLAGGQSLVPMMNFRYVQPDALIDINNVAGLDGIAVKDGQIRIGACTRQRTLEFSPDIAAHCPLMAEAIPHIGHRQTRNRGTIGGSLAHADPAAELAAVAIAQDAILEVSSVRGVRHLPAADFFLGFMTTALEPDEMLSAIVIPVWPKPHGYAFIEFARRRGDFAIVAAAVLIALDNNGAVDRASLTVAGANHTPMRIPAAETALRGQKLAPERIAEAARLAGEVEATEDVHVSANYRQHLARVLMGRALKKASARATGAA